MFLILQHPWSSSSASPSDYGLAWLAKEVPSAELKRQFLFFMTSFFFDWMLFFQCLTAPHFQEGRGERSTLSPLAPPYQAPPSFLPECSYSSSASESSEEEREAASASCSSPSGRLHFLNHQRKIRTKIRTTGSSRVISSLIGISISRNRGWRGGIIIWR